MRICVVTLDYVPTRTSGLAVYGEHLIAGYVRRGHAVTVLSLGRKSLSKVEHINGVEVYRTDGERFNWFGLGWYGASLVRRLQQSRGLDAIHFLDVHFAFAYRGQYVASVFQSFRQRATAFRGMPYHTSTPNLAFRLLYYYFARYGLERPAAHRAQSLIAPSQSTADEFYRHYDIQPEKIFLVPLGIDLERFHRVDATALRRQLGLTDRFVILNVCHATPRKGLEIAIEALKMLPKEVVFMHVGKWDPAYRARLQPILAGVSDRWMEAGYVADADLAAYYSLADVAVFPSWLEGFGIPPAEAMACQTPVIAADSGSLPEIVGDSGILFPPGDHRALAASIQECLRRDDYRLSLAQHGMKRAHMKFGLDRMIDQTLAVLEQRHITASLR